MSSLFGRIDEAEAREDVDAAVEKHRLPELHDVEDFILTHLAMFRSIAEKE